MRNNGVRVYVAIEHLEKKPRALIHLLLLKALTDFAKLTLRSLNSIQTVEGSLFHRKQKTV